MRGGTVQETMEVVTDNSGDSVGYPARSCSK